MEGTADRPGVIPRAIEALLKQAADSNHTFLFSFSMLEIYMGYLKDLLVPTQTTKATDRMPLSPCLSIQTDSKGEVEIDNLVTIQVSDFNQAKRLYKLGCHFRSTASTNSNKSSSRSHSMIRILMTCSDATERRRIKNKIWMVDLGGSERVLKTRAWGRRFEEGKAINLSLSALGDVINALQRKKCHIPYRNSKLTQVLKDSLGEDSKTLMLVHVSPKEEDLCETVCSLNFATRVRSTHLGNEESTEAKVHKEVEMTSLQQKMKWIEDKRHKARREINTLNEKLEDLTRIPPSSSKKLEDSHQSFELEVPQSNVEIGKKTGNVTAAPSSASPKFMRSTICSRRKSGIDHQTSEETDPVPVRRRRLSSYHAKSVALPIMGMSEYNSESSISRTSCLVGSKLKCNSDNETEGSQVKSEFDIKKVIFPIQDKSPRSSNHKKAHLSCNKGHRNRKMHQFNFPKFITVDNWLNLHKNAYGTSSYIHWNKRVLAIPKPEKNSKGNQQRLLEQLHDEKVYDYKLSKKKIKHDELNRLTEGAAGRPRSKEVADTMLTVFKDFSNEDSTSNSISPTHTTDGKLMIQAQGTVDDVSIEEYICSTSTPPDTWCGVFNKKEGETGVNRMAMEQTTYETPSLEALMLKNSWASIHSASDVSGSITALIGDFGVSISRSELKSPHQKVPTEIGKNSEEEEVRVSSQYSGKLQHQNLLVDKANQVHLAMSIFQSQGKTKSTGICDLLKQKIQILCTCAILALGFQSLGLEHDFFYALML